MDRQRKTFIGKTIAVLAVIPVLIYAHAAGPDPGKSGAPGESTCAEAECHVGTALNGGGGRVTIDAGGSTYTPGLKQRISAGSCSAAVASHSGGPRAGAIRALCYRHPI